MTPSMRKPALAAAAAIAVALAACRDVITTQVQRPADSLHFLRPALGSPPLLDSVVTFWARTDADREAVLRYAPSPGSTEGDEFLRFTVPAGALALHPDATPFLQRDSILITIRVADPSRLILDFSPAKLSFSPAHPAQLKVSFRHADHDFNGDGVEDAEDTTVEKQIAFWKQELPGQPWFRLTSALHVDTEEAEASILGFTGYALAY